MLRQYFMLKPGEWHSPLPPDEAVARIQGAIESLFDILPVNGGLVGMTGSDWARVRRRRAFNNSFAPVLVMRFQPTRGGSRVRYGVGPNLYARAFPLFWVTLILMMSWRTVTWPPSPVMLVPLAMVGAMVLLMLVGQAVGKADADWLQQHVADLLEVETAPTGAVRR